MQGIQDSLEALDREVASVKNTARSNEEKMKRELATLKAKISSQEDRVQSLVDGLQMTF